MQITSKYKTTICIMALLSAMAFSGCEIYERTWPAIADKYPFKNYYYDAKGMSNVTSVVLMPFMNSTKCPEASAGITDAFVLELSKLGRFDVIVAEYPAGWLQNNLASRGAFNSGNIKAICEIYGADAVIVGEVTRYEPYKPFVLGLRFSMISADKGRTIWNVDETLDSGMKKVSYAAKNYYNAQVDGSVYTTGRDVMENSITLYTRFVCSSMVATLQTAEQKKR
jgi:hypothetical protein